LNLFEAIKNNLNIEIGSDMPRYQLDGWYYQGECPVKCPACSNSYKIFRCPYTTSKGEYKYWAVVCDCCETTSTLDSVSKASKKALTKWDKTKIQNKSINESEQLPTPTTVENPSKPEVARATKRKFGSELAPTDEQRQIITAMDGTGDIAVNALAGTGKTTTLRLISEAVAPKRGHYVAFNKAIVDDAKSKFSSNINCVTAHGLAYRSVGYRFKNRFDSPRVSWKDLASYFDMEGFGFKSPSGSHYFEPFQMAKYASGAIWGFCKSTATEIGFEHVPVIPLVQVSEEVRNNFCTQVISGAQSMWKDLLEVDGYMKFEHDHYLKMWQLGKPVIPGDIILFDEAQDADPVMLDVVNSQQAQLIYCGDTYQSIYEWRGAKDALSLVHVDERYWLTQSFRFGPEIAEIGNQFLRRLGAPKEIRGLESIQSKVGKLVRPDAVLCRTNFGAIISLRELQSQGRNTALMGNVKESLLEFTRGCIELKNGRRTGHPELGLFQNWDEALDWARDESEAANNTTMLIRLVESIGAEAMHRTLGLAVDEKVADVVITTAHKAKGREWDGVSLAGDFKHPDDMDSDELRLLYVSVTRAKKHLDITQLPEQQGDKPRLFNNLWTSASRDSTSGVKKQRPPIDINTKTSSVGPSPQRRGIIQRLLGD
jgi:hypothetical protein